MMETFKVTLIVMLFYSTCITLLTHTMPANSLTFVTGFSDVGGSISLETTRDQIQGSLESQTNIPIIDVGALAFYTGNIIIDLLLNFTFAIPQMVTLLITGLLNLLALDTALVSTVQLFVSVVISVLYFLGIIELISSIRSGVKLT